MTKGNSTTNAILVIILALIVGFGVWYVMDRREKAAEEEAINTLLELGVEVREE